MVDVAPPDETEIRGTAVTSSPLAADAPVRIPVERYISASRHLERFLGLDPGGTEPP